MYAIHREGFLELCPVFIIWVQMPCALALSSWNLAFEKGEGGKDELKTSALSSTYWMLAFDVNISG